uniref:AbrB family transcriptional regulator n=1 Tax=uncultured Allobacillus sp. TaxID=1638025 RepID=UPI0025921CFA|nr:AbrB family transcriptional regulator [uncultured Allobacillus sp.]
MTASVIFYLILALIGGAIGYFSRFPVGVVLGSMFAVGLAKYFNILHLERTVSISFVIQVLLGAMLGLSLIKINKKQLITLGKSLVAVVVTVVIFTGLAGATLGWITGTNPVLATLAASPGAIVEVATLAQELNLDAPTVVLVHLVRVIVIMSLFPVLLKLAMRLRKKEGDVHG